MEAFGKFFQSSQLAYSCVFEHNNAQIVRTRLSKRSNRIYTHIYIKATEEE